MRKWPFLGVNDYFLRKCSLIVGDDKFWGISAHFLGGKLPSFGLSDAWVGFLGILLQIHQKILAWVRPPPLFLAMPRFSRRLLQHSLPYKESCVQLPMASLKGCHQLYGSSYDYHIIDCTHVPRRPCRTLTLRKKKVEGHWYDPPWHELSENLKKFLRTSSGISSLQELLAELVLTTHYRRM